MPGSKFCLLLAFALASPGALAGELTLDDRGSLDLQTARLRSPQPRKFLGFEGRFKTDPERISTVAALADVEAAVMLGDEFLRSGLPADRESALAFVQSWSRVYVPDGNPINEKELMPLVLVYAAFREAAPPEERGRIDSWLFDLADAQMRHRTALNHRTRDNWNSKRVLIVTTIAAATRNAYWWRTGRILLREHISASLYAGGASLDFIRRDSLHYHISNVQPLVQCAVLFHRYDETDHYHWLAPQGASIARSVEFILPYVRGELTRFEWRKSTVQFDHARAESGDPEFDKDSPWKADESFPLLQVAGYFEPALEALVPAKDGTATGARPGWFLRLARQAVVPAMP